MKWNLNRIPKVANFYWGNTELPLARYLSIASFSAYNPDWEIIVHRPEILSGHLDDSWITGEHCGANERVIIKCYWDNVSHLPNVVVRQWDLSKTGIKSEIHKSDYLRWKLLSKDGGLWSDMDIIYFAPITMASFNETSMVDADSAICSHSFRGMDSVNSIGFMLAAPGSRLFGEVHKRCNWEIGEGIAEDSYQKIGRDLLNTIVNASGLDGDVNGYLEQAGVGTGVSFDGIDCGLIGSDNFIKDDEIINIPLADVYPYSWENIVCSLMMGRFSEELIGNSTIGIHWFAGDRRMGSFMNGLTEDNIYSQSECVIIKILRKVLDDHGDYLFTR